jgi:hypothetical protein
MMTVIRTKGRSALPQGLATLGLGLALGCIAVGVYVDEARGSGCVPAKTVDYLRHLRDLPAIKHVPSDHRLSLKPKGLRLLPIGGLLPGGGKAGFRLEAESLQTYRLGWKMNLETYQVNARGKPVRQLASKRLRLESPRVLGSDPASMTVSLSAQPAIYRQDLTIRDGHGSQVARFSEYVRVVPYRKKARLTASPQVVAPGGLVFARIENLGTVSLSFGPAITLEQRTAAGWNVPPGQPKFWPPIAIEIGGGAAGECEHFRLPHGLSPGTYRLTKEVQMGPRPSDLHASFQVVG